MKQIIKKVNWLKVSQLVLTTVLVFSPLLVNAQGIVNSSICVGGLNCNAGQDVNSLIKTVIQWMLGIAFGIAVLFLIIGGFWYITSGGNEETAEKGKNTVVNALIGIVIIVLAFVIVSVVANLVGSAGTGGVQ
ncbi:MAG: pilin [Patescibacteria group bacterium]|nr:pilin [Patescibacteria group bacterium]